MTIVLDNMVNFTAVTAEMRQRFLELAKNLFSDLLPQPTAEPKMSAAAAEKSSTTPVRAYRTAAAEKEICLVCNIVKDTAIWDKIDNVKNTRWLISRAFGKEYKRTQQREKELLSSALPGTVLSGWGTEEQTFFKKKSSEESHRFSRKENSKRKDRTRQQRQWEREQYGQHRSNQKIISGFDLRKICFPECA